MPPDNDVQKEIELLEQRFAENSQGLVFAHLADAYRRAGEYDKAEGLLLHGLTIHPSYTSAYNVLGRVYLDSGRYADAHAQFSKVLELDPQNLIALRALGDLAARAGRVDEARSWYERMLQIDPRSKEAREGLSRLETETVDAAAEEAASAGSGEPAEAPTEAAAELEATAEPESAGEPPAADVSGPDVLSEAQPVADREPEPWDIADLLGGEEEEGAIDTDIEPVEGLLTKETQRAPDGSEEFAVDTSWLAEAVPGQEEGETAGEGAREEPTVEGAPSMPEATGEAAALDSLDLGALDDWAPDFLGGGDRPERTGDIVADSIAEGMTGQFPVEGLEETPEADEVPAEAEAGRPEAGVGADGELVTETMAEVYVNQGLYEDALSVYRRLAETRPGDERIRARIAELEARLAEVRAAAEEGERELAELLELTRAAAREPAEAEEPAEAVPEPEAVSEPEAEPVAAEVAERLVEPEDGEFRFEDEAPVAGLEHLDPFAASFHVMVVAGVRAPAAGPAPEEPAPEPVSAQPAGPLTPEEAEPAEPEEAAVAEAAAPAIEEEPEPEPAMAGAEEPAVEVADGLVFPVVEPEPVELEEAEPEPEVFAAAGATADLAEDDVAEEAQPEPAAAEPEESAAAVTVGDYLKSLLAYTPASAGAGEDTGAAEDGGRASSDDDGDGPEDLEEFHEWLRSLKR
jgi:tetratricopeptide (TPR) repeat protein